MSEFMKRLGKGLVKVGEPHESGWYEEEGYSEDADYLVVDDVVMIPKSKVLEVLTQVLNAFPKPFFVEQGMKCAIVYKAEEIDEWLKQRMGGIPKASD